MMVMRTRKTIFVVCVILTVSVVLFLIKRPNISSPEHEQYTSDTKFVLYWTPFWNQKDYFLGYGFDPFRNCEYKNCYATANRSVIALEKFDALIFHASYSNNKHGVPWTRKSHQMYIFMNVEAPVYISPELKQYNSYFNWTMTYRFDSDIIRRHGYVIKGRTNYTMPSEEFLKNKTKLAAWFVSNCRTPGKREVLGKAMRNVIPTDVYGYCGNLTCSRNAHNGKTSSDECYEMVERNYKFYFSFENSYCKDYSTEKLYNILQKDVVPVVYGAGDYKLSAPPNSVINVEDFDNVEDLGDYLKYLDGNMEEYSRYFEWKKEYRITTSPLPSGCQICQKLHEPTKTSIYYDLKDWWWGGNKSNCKTNKGLPSIVSELLKE